MVDLIRMWLDWVLMRVVELQKDKWNQVAKEQR